MRRRHTLNTGWYNYSSQTKINTIPAGMNCSLKTKHKNSRRDTVFSESHTHTHFKYRMVQIWFPTEDAREIESWGPGITRQGWRCRSWQRVGCFPGIPRRTVAKVVLESWCYTRKGWQRCSRRIVAQFQGIPSGVALGTNSPEGSRGDPWDLELYQECWNSGGPWGLVLHQADWDRSGPRGSD